MVRRHPRPHQPPPPARYLTITETARLLSTSRTTIYRLIEQGHLPTVTIGSLRRIPIEALEAREKSA